MKVAKTKFLFIGGAYGDYRKVSEAPPTDEDWKSWANGNLEMFRIQASRNSKIIVSQPHSSGMWELLPGR